MSTLVAWVSEFTAQTGQYCLTILGALVLVGIIVLIFGKRR